MSDIPRFTIDDLRARYDLEPSLDDVYVEGIFDKEIIDRLISLNEKSYRATYEIDAVNVPAELLAKHELTEGSKQRVIALARELAKLKGRHHYRCLVDRDLDHWFGELEKTKSLTWTDHTSIELYYLSEDFVKDIILVTARCNIANWRTFYDSLIEALRLTYAMRLADRSLKLSMRWINLDKSLSARDSQLVFDHGGYVKKLLVANQKASHIPEFEKEVLRWKAKLTNDPRSHIRGHDLVSMIAWSIRSFKGQKEYASDAAIERIFVLLAPRANEILNTLN